MLANPSADLRKKISENPGVVFEDAARENDVPPSAVVAALPNEMRRFAPGAEFIDAMDDISTWGDVTVIVHTEDGIIEFGGPVPKGQVARGYFNLKGRTGFHGHLKHERCANVAFVERPFMNRTSCLLIFLNTDGGIMFKIFVGRDEKGALKADQLSKFRTLRDRLCNANQARLQFRLKCPILCAHDSAWSRESRHAAGRIPPLRLHRVARRAPERSRPRGRGRLLVPASDEP
jgi:putative heme utilization carrier protein HutX